MQALTLGSNGNPLLTDSRTTGHGPPAPPHARVLAESASFARRHCRRLLAISCVLLLPCFWHRRIVTSDLGSHLYNAWLARLIGHGQAPGLWIARQWTNVLFDLLLSGLSSVFGFRAAEKMAVSLAVLIFFWGVFALVSAATRRAPWFLVPCIALVTYGYAFHMAFFNYYLSLGLSFFSLAIFWRGRGWERFLGYALAPLIVLAHPLGLMWLVGASVYVGIAEVLPPRYQWLLLVPAAAALAGAHYYLWSHFVVEAAPAPLYMFNGADQLLLFGERYHLVERAALAFGVVAFATDFVRRRREPGMWRDYAIPLQLYVLVALAVPLLPRGITFSQHNSAIALLTERLTSVSAALVCCVLGAMRPSKWHLAGSAAIAAVFFSFVYQDTAVFNRMEQQAEQLVRTLPPNQRVLATILAPSGSRILIQHMIDRACIGHCFSYGNYEPASSDFRVRALPGNSYAMSLSDDTASMEEGTYVVKLEDLPAYQVYQCDLSGTILCVSALEAGEENDTLGVHPDE
jgi:hypothetical protein